MPEPGLHTHLDHARRQPGECPACDHAWAVQTAIVERFHYTEVADTHGRSRRQHLATLGPRRYGRPR